MSVVEAGYLPVAVTPARPSGPKDSDLGPLTATGVLAFLTGFSVLASGISSLRPEIGGLLLQPCLIPLGLAMPFVLLTRLGEFPGRILGFLALFTAMYCFSALGGHLGEIAKALSAMVMIVVPALLIKSRKDFIAGALGMILAVGLLGFRGLEAGQVDSYGINPMEDVANKNSYSLYALPAILLAGASLIRFRSLSWWIKVIIGVSITATSISIAVSGNRSGWLGLAFVGLLLMKDRKLAGTLTVLLIAIGAGYWITNFANTSVAERRLEETQEGTSSDKLRLELIRNAFVVSLEHPLLGVSPEHLPFELGRLSKISEVAWIDPHNVFGHVAGGSGLICLLGLIGAGWSMWHWPISAKTRKDPSASMYIAAVKVMHSMLILWVVRGMFSREILYNPGVCIGLGIAIGWCMYEQGRLQQSQSSHAVGATAFARAVTVPGR